MGAHFLWRAILVSCTYSSSAAPTSTAAAWLRLTPSKNLDGITISSCGVAAELDLDGPIFWATEAVAKDGTVEAWARFASNPVGGG